MEITSQELKSKINSGESVMVAFTASWCGPCKLYKPLYQKISESSDVPMYIMDVEQNTDLAVELGIRAVPTTKAFSKGGEVFSKPGMISETELKGTLKNLIHG
jgi:thioredoxin-like negative regulator of GroEL